MQKKGSSKVRNNKNSKNYSWIWYLFAVLLILVIGFFVYKGISGNVIVENADCSSYGAWKNVSPAEYFCSADGARLIKQTRTASPVGCTGKVSRAIVTPCPSDTPICSAGKCIATTTSPTTTTPTTTTTSPTTTTTTTTPPTPTPTTPTTTPISSEEGDTARIKYSSNGATNGTIPRDTQEYLIGSKAIVKSNEGNLTRRGYTFNGWNTFPDSSGVNKMAGSTIKVGLDNVLYADWVPNLWLIDNGRKGVLKFNTLNGQIEKYTLSNRSYVRAARMDATGNMWVAVRSGLVKLDGSTGKIISSYNFSTEDLDGDSWGMVIDQEGYIWIASGWGADFLMKINPSNGKTKKYFFDYDIQQILVGVSGSLWAIGSGGPSVLKINTTTGKPIGEYPIKAKLTTKYSFDDYPQAMEMDSSGNIWVLGDSYLYKLNGATGATIAQIKVDTALMDLAIDQKGNIWVTNLWNNLLYKLDSAGKIVGKYSIADPWLVNIDPVGNVWVRSYYVTDITKVEGVSGKIVGVYSYDY